MNSKSDTASNGGVSGASFAQVLRRELNVVAARRQALDTERGDLDTGPPANEPSLDTAWQARLLGLSFSGGGIRSATFNLGVLQALARCGLLRYVDYLSTVSGGGYIGSWLTALSQRRFARRANDGPAIRAPSDELLPFTKEGFARFEKRLAWSAGDEREHGLDGEDRAISFLREFSNYLTPKLGLFSGDTWALLAIYVRNAILNQLVLLLALVAVLLIPRLLSHLFALGEAETGTGFLWWMAAILLVHLLVCWKVGKNLAGVTSLGLDRNAEASPRVIAWIGAPLLFIGLSATSWLGHLDAWLASVVSSSAEPGADWRTWVAAAVIGALVSLFTWSLACLSAYRHHRHEPWTDLETTFWTRMVGYSLASGPVFGILMHGAGVWLFTDGVYSGYRLVAGPPALALAVLLAGALHVGLAAKNVSAQYAEWLSRFGGLMLIGTLGWIGFNVIVFLGPLMVAWFRGVAQAAISSGWLLTTLASVVFGRSVVASSRALPRLFMQVAPWIFIVGLGVGLSALLQSGLHFGATHYGPDATTAADAKLAVYDHLEAPAAASGTLELMKNYGAWLEATELWWVVLIAIAIASVLTWLLSLRIDINVFSLHGMYANRLVRCYLGASVANRTANPFSGLSSRDDLELEAVPRYVEGCNMLVHGLADGQLAGGVPLVAEPAVYPGPYHLINTAINLVAGGNLAYQERKAGAFLLSPLYCGFQLESSSSEGVRSEDIDAYRPTEEFSSLPRRLTLGEAIATSGAAASPNMGYHSTPAFAFLMGVFNIRLGRWVGNPYTPKNDTRTTWFQSGPGVALFHLLKEVFGLTSKESDFVYLSDGGHFENLGVYELVRRRCRYIIACDAGADERYGFEDLANAIRKCRRDLGVEIDLDVRQIAEADAQRYNAAPCAIGQVRYSDKEVGTILYIKASRRQGAPPDVMHYASEHAAFPHESTADQFFSESQFESYRRLGNFLAREILGVSGAATHKGVNVDQLFRDLGERWYRPSPAIASNFVRLAQEVDDLFERLRTSQELDFLSRQFYPEWRSLLGEKVVDAAAQAHDLVYVPPDEERLRQGFYFCNSLTQLMESVYVDLNLETEWQHPDNSGWLNVFNHWAWSGMFRVTWAVTAATYGGRFRAFCERRLNLTLGDVRVNPLFEGRWAERKLERRGLNQHELGQIAELPLAADANAAVYRLELHVSHPIGERPVPMMQFGVGYAVLMDNDLVMYRVQDHLRGMGLGRRGLVALVEDRKVALGHERLAARDVLDFLTKFHEQTDRGKLADFRAMVVSVNEEWSEGKPA